MDNNSPRGIQSIEVGGQLLIALAHHGRPLALKDLAAAAGMKPSKRRDSLIEHADKARLSYELVRLREDAPLPLPIESLVVKELDRAVLTAWLSAQGFRSTIARLGLEMPAAVPVPVPVPVMEAPPQGDLGLGGAAQAASGFGPYETVVTEDALRAWAAEASASPSWPASARSWAARRWATTSSTRRRPTRATWRCCTASAPRRRKTAGCAR